MRIQSFQIGLGVFAFLAAASDYLTGLIHPPVIWITLFGSLGLWLIFNLRYSEELCLDFDREVYMCERGILPGMGFTGGRLTDIDHIHLKQNVDAEGRVSHVSWLAFRPELQREWLSFRGLYHPITADLFETQMLRLLETATKLDISVHDESGWRGGWRTPAEKPTLYIILPGEPHPSTLLPPPAKW